MSRYIDADAMINDVAKFYDEAEHLETFDMVNKICDHIHNAPTIDAVSVVRCKECRYWKWIEWAKEYRCTVRNTAFNARADDYCSYGEKRVSDGKRSI